MISNSNEIIQTPRVPEFILLCGVQCLPVKLHSSFKFWNMFKYAVNYFDLWISLASANGLLQDLKSTQICAKRYLQRGDIYVYIKLQFPMSPNLHYANLCKMVWQNIRLKRSWLENIDCSILHTHMWVTIWFRKQSRQVQRTTLTALCHLAKGTYIWKNSLICDISDNPVINLEAIQWNASLLFDITVFRQIRKLVNIQCCWFALLVYLF